MRREVRMSTEWGRRGWIIWLAFIAVIFLLTGSPAAADVREEVTEKLKETQRVFLAEYPDGVRERIVVKYEGYHYRKQWQTGEAAKTEVRGIEIKVNVTDTRKCHWNTKAWVVRRAFFLSHSGISAPISDYEKIFYTSHYADRGADNFLESAFYHRTCGDSKESYDSSVASSKNSLINEFDAIVKKDQASSIEFLKNLVKAVKLDLAP
jgi:hypothetical protein